MSLTASGFVVVLLSLPGNVHPHVFLSTLYLAFLNTLTLYINIPLNYTANIHRHILVTKQDARKFIWRKYKETERSEIGSWLVSGRPDPGAMTELAFPSVKGMVLFCIFYIWTVFCNLTSCVVRRSQQ